MILALALAFLLPVLPAPSPEAREWRPWCGSGPGAEPRTRRPRSAGTSTATRTRKTPETTRRRSARRRRRRPRPRWSASGDAPGPGGGPGPCDSGPERGERRGLPASPAGNPAARRHLLGRLPPHGLGEPGPRLHAEASGGRPGQEALVGRAPGRAPGGPGPARGALRPHLPRPVRNARDAACSARSCAPSRSATGSTCSRSR